LLQYEWYAGQVYVTVERPSVCPSVFLVDRQQQRRAAGLLLSALQAGDRYRSTAAGALRAPCSRHRRSAVNAGSVTLTADGGD